jgi:3-oxoacyl-[acyl-carrier-protein] synthase-1
MSSVAITALGMVTALGHDAVISCAAARAGLVGATELKLIDFELYGHFGSETFEGPPAVFGHEVRGLADGFAGVGKAILHGAKALTELQGRRRLTEGELARTGLFINLGDGYVEDVVEQQARAELEDVNPRSPLPSSSWQLQCARLVPKLCQHAGLPIPERNCHVHHGGHAGLAASLAHALLLMKSGVVDRCIVGGIDSRVDALFLTSAARAHLLKTNDNPVGMMPGEAAAFFLLEKPGSFQRHSHPALAYVGAHAEASDPPFTAELPRVDGMCQAVRAVAAAEPRALARAWLLSDINGTARRSTEWAYTLVKLQHEIQLADLPRWYPAASFGDVGAATGAVAVVMAARAFERGYAPGEAALVLLASERGGRGAVLVKKTA